MRKRRTREHIITVTMAALERVLLELGYIKRVVANSHLRFEPSEQQGGVILLPLFKADEVVPSIDLLMAEVTVDNWGIADRETFERMLSESVHPKTLAKPEPVEAAA